MGLMQTTPQPPPPATRDDMLDALRFCAQCGEAEAAAADTASSASAASSARSAAALCVATVLNDARFSLLGGREDRPLSLRSVSAASVVLFLQPPSFRGEEARCIPLTCSKPVNCCGGRGIAVSRDGAHLIVAYKTKLRVFRISDGALVRVFVLSESASYEWMRSRAGAEPPVPTFYDIQHIHVGPDGYVFIASNDAGVQMLTPKFEYAGTFAAEEVQDALCVCVSGDGDVVVVIEYKRLNCASFFRRCDGGLLSRMPSRPPTSTDGFLPSRVCFIADTRYFAVLGYSSVRREFSLRVYTAAGEVVRQFGEGVLAWRFGEGTVAHKHPRDIACTTSGEIVVADSANRHVAVFSVSGKLVHSFRKRREDRSIDVDFRSVAVHGRAIYARNAHGNRCSVFVSAGARCFNT